MLIELLAHSERGARTIARGRPQPCLLRPRGSWCRCRVRRCAPWRSFRRCCRRPAAGPASASCTGGTAARGRREGRRRRTRRSGQQTHPATPRRPPAARMEQGHAVHAPRPVSRQCLLCNCMARAMAHQHAQHVADGADIHDDVANERAARHREPVRPCDDRHDDAHHERASACGRAGCVALGEPSEQTGTAPGRMVFVWQLRTNDLPYGQAGVGAAQRRIRAKDVGSAIAKSQECDLKRTCSGRCRGNSTYA